VPMQLPIKRILVIFIVALCILKSILFTHQQMHYLLNLERFKIYTGIHTNIATYMFRSSTIIRELVLCLAKVMLEHSVKLCPYSMSWSGVCVVCCAE
jgi:hypothetical protein